MDAAIRGIEEARTEAAAMGMGCWGHGYLTGLRVAGLITDAEEQDGIQQVRAAQAAKCELLIAIDSHPTRAQQERSMKRPHDKAMPSRRIARWVQANQEGIAWACMGFVSAVSTVIAWRLLIA